jgi:hypothetical protein
VAAEIHRHKRLGSNINTYLFKYIMILNIEIRIAGSVETVNLDVEINKSACFKVRGVLSWG